MEFNSPSIPEAIADICKEGAAEIIALPMFLYKGNHILHDIPKELKKQGRKSLCNYLYG